MHIPNPPGDGRLSLLSLTALFCPWRPKLGDPDQVPQQPSSRSVVHVARHVLWSWDTLALRLLVETETRSVGMLNEAPMRSAERDNR